MSPRRTPVDPFSKAVSIHLQEHLGRPKTLYTPKDAAEPVVAVAEFSPTEDRPYWTYVTVGMAAQAQSLPDDPPEWLTSRTETLLYTRQQAQWAVEVLNLIGRLPFESESWLFWWHTVDLGSALDEKPDTKLTALLLLPPYFEEEGFDDLEVGGQPIRFLTSLAITEAERQYALSQGGQSLEEKLMEANVPPLFIRDRASTV